MTEQEYHQWELEQQEQEEQGQMLNDSLYDEEIEKTYQWVEDNEEFIEKQMRLGL